MSPQNTHGRHYTAQPSAAVDTLKAALRDKPDGEARVEWLYRTLGDRAAHLPVVDAIKILLALDDAPSLRVDAMAEKIAELEAMVSELEVDIDNMDWNQGDRD